jgi:methylated-DNA-[protein]-cysteine S-methyltransferase
MNDQVTYSFMESPIGRLLLLSDGVALGGVYMESHKRGPQLVPHWQRDDRSLASVADQLRAYFAGELQQFDVPLALGGTEFQLRVWNALRAISFGHTQSYAELADCIGAPRAVRAVGAAVGRNPASIIVPCHRVVGSDGGLTGFAGGLARKSWLLEHEREQREKDCRADQGLSQRAACV